MYGVGDDFAYDVGDPVAPIGPDLRNQNDWWFRGPSVRAKKPQDGAVMELPAGGKVDIEIACHVAWTSLGDRTTDLSDELAACPDNYGAFHSGDPAGPIDENLLSGCGLAIADVDDIEDVTMDNLAIFSVNHRCVRDRVTSFEIPAKMPACTGDKCVCGWFWLANNGTANFYMTPFDCAVTGSPADATPIAAPQDPVFCGDDPSSCTTGSKRPLYAYNYPNNVPSWDNDHRPGYHASWSFPNNGAQNDIFESSGNSGGALPSSTASTTSASLSNDESGAASTTSLSTSTRPALANSSTSATPVPTARPRPSLVSPLAVADEEDEENLPTTTRTRARWSSLATPFSRPSSDSSSASEATSATRRPWRSRHGYNGRGWRWRHRTSSRAAEAAATSEASSSSSSAEEPSQTGQARIARDVSDVVGSLLLTRERLAKRFIKRGDAEA
ncbi:hypothetical protein JCM6882_000396 [Rhodosporidiobolus microsporus]